MQSLGPNVITRLRPYAEERGVTLQELIRAKIIPEWEAWMQDGGRTLEKRAYSRGWQAHKAKVKRENGCSSKLSR
jgi:hypothetical protein